jgi:hypothetical protein
VAPPSMNTSAPWICWRAVDLLGDRRGGERDQARDVLGLAVAAQAGARQLAPLAVVAAQALRLGRCFSSDSRRPVTVIPGCTDLTATPSRSPSSASALVKLVIAALTAPPIMKLAVGVLDAPPMTLTTDPGAPLSSGQSARDSRT